jgi:hypothetical protein
MNKLPAACGSQAGVAIKKLLITFLTIVYVYLEKARQKIDHLKKVIFFSACTNYHRNVGCYAAALGYGAAARPPDPFKMTFKESGYATFQNFTQRRLTFSGCPA